MDKKIYITKTGLNRLITAKNNDETVNVSHAIIDNSFLSESIDATNLEAVQVAATDSNGKEARFDVTGTNTGATLVLHFVIPANSGGYSLGGVGWYFDDGVMFAYQRLEKDAYKSEAEGASEEIVFSASIEHALNNELSNVDISIQPSGLFATQAEVEKAEKIVVDKIDTFATDFAAKFEQLLKTQQSEHKALVNKLNGQITALEKKVADNRRHTDNVNKKVDSNRRHTDNVNKKVDSNRRHHDGQHRSAIKHSYDLKNQAVVHANNLHKKHIEERHTRSSNRSTYRRNPR